MNQPHRFQPVHARHEDIEKQQVEIAGLEYRKSVAAIIGNDNTVPGPFQQQPDGRLNRAVIVNNQNFRQRLSLRSERGIMGNGRLQRSLNFRCRASPSRRAWFMDRIKCTLRSASCARLRADMDRNGACRFDSREILWDDLNSPKQVPP
jgi:hypothetical protein